MKLTSINPSNYQKLGEVESSTESEIKQAVKLAHLAKNRWQELGIEGRNKHLKNFYQLIENNKQELAELASKEMGMLIKDSEEDVQYGLDYLHWYSDNATKYLSPEITYQDEKEIHTVFREPYGVAAVIVPWNFPMSNFVWQVGQNLIAGNTVVFKGSEEAPLFSQKLQELANLSSLPTGVFNIIFGAGKEGDFLIHQDINLICFTGSTKTGQYIYQVAAEKFIPARMELGGSAPGIVFADTDIDKVFDMIVDNRFFNCGQICDGLKRLLVHQSIFDKVVVKLKKHLSAIKVGDAMDKATQLGPLVAERQVDVLSKQVADAINKGATILTGGQRPKNLTGAYYQPTLVTDISREMKLWTEEVFGPVLPVMKFDSTDEAIELANDTQYGLGGYIFTEDKQLFDKVASQLQTGMVSQNNVSYVRECNPFGGYKKSGLGREHGKYGFEDVTQIKVVSKEK